MSELLTFTSASATIYGSLAGARAYLGAEHTAWDVTLDATITTAQRRALVKATRFLDRLVWQAAYNTFALRDALTTGVGAGDAAFPFRAAAYELAVLVLEDPDILIPDESANSISSISAGGDSVTYRSDASTPDPVPGLAMALVGQYLASAAASYATTAHAGTGTGETGSADNPFGAVSDYDRTEPF